MTEFLVGLLVGALALVPTVLAMRAQRDKTEGYRAHEAAVNEGLRSDLRTAELMAAAPTLPEKVGIAALLSRPDPTPEPAGRWLYDDSGLNPTFVPDEA